MKNLSKRAFSLLLTILTVISITQTVDLKTTVFAKFGDFTIVNGIITKYNGSGGVVKIPNGVKGIGNSAFQGCTGLTGIIIPDSVTFILGAAFAGDYDAETEGYSRMNLTSVTIGSGIISIEDNVFAGCDKLTQINVDSDNRAYSSEGGVLYNKEKTEIVLCPKGKSGSITVPNSIKSIEANAFSNCSGLTSVIIPDSVKSIGTEAFRGCIGLKNITIPNSITSIGYSTFSYCRGLLSVTIPGSVTNIGQNAFEGCDGLKNIIIPDGVTSIGDSAFAYCDVLKTVIISESVTSIGAGAFSGCRELAKINIPDSVKNIGGSAFSDTAWYDSKPVGLVYAGKAVYRYKGTMPAASSVKLKNDTAFIIAGAFDSCAGLVSITIPGSVASIGSYAFINCTGLKNITIQNGVKNIGGSTFSGCSGLKTITIPGSVISIGPAAFAGCKGLASITIPISVTTIGSRAFTDCTGLTSIAIPSSFTSIGDEAFDNTAWLGKQPAGLVYAGKAAYVYKGKMPANSVIVLKKDTTSIAASAFANCNGLKSITIPYGVKNIGLNAFYNCSSLEGVAIPNSVTFIGASAFYDSGLKTITIPDSVKSIEPYLFSRCHGLTKISLGKSVTNIGRSAFERCDNLASITIPNGVTAIEYSTFSGCSALTSIIIPNDVTVIGERAFSWCRGLTGISISGSTVKIASDAFNDNDFMTVFCPAGSYAEVYSKQHSIAYSNGTFPSKPSAPASLTAAGKTAGTVSLSWPAVTGATGYNIYIDSKKSNYLPVSETTYTATYLTQNTAYSFSVKAVNAGGASSASTPLIVTTLISTPYSLKTISASYNSIKISWKPVSKVTGYVVFRLNSSTGKYSTIKVTTSTSYTDTSLTTGETYYYKVKSYKTVNGATLYSISTAVLNCKPVPSVPANFKATGYSDTSIKLSWSTVAGATGYEIYKYNPIIKDFYKLKVLTATSYINSCHSKGVDYSYKVRGYTTVNGVKVYGTFTASMTAKP